MKWKAKAILSCTNLRQNPSTFSSLSIFFNSISLSLFLSDSSNIHKTSIFFFFSIISNSISNPKFSSMENNLNAKLGSVGGGGPKPNAAGDQMENPNLDRSDESQEEEAAPGSLDMSQSPSAAAARSSSRTPFTNLSQVDADLALARTLQEQVRLFFGSYSVL